MTEKYVYLDNQTSETQIRITLGWAAYEKIKDLFKNDIPVDLKRKAFNQCIIPSVFSYEAETLTLTKKAASNLRIAQRGECRGFK